MSIDGRRPFGRVGRSKASDTWIDRHHPRGARYRWTGTDRNRPWELEGEATLLEVDAEVRLHVCVSNLVPQFNGAYARARVRRTPGPSASAMTFSGSTGVQLRKIEHVRGARRRIDRDSIRIESWRPSLNAGRKTACGSFSRFVRIILMDERIDLTACCRMTLGVRVRSRARP